MTATTVPDLKRGTWKLDAGHSEVGFSVRHMMISKVRGRFRSFEGTLTVPEDLSKSTVEVTIDAKSFDTGHEARDAAVLSEEYLDADRYPQLTYKSTSIREAGDGTYILDGELTIKGVTRPVPLKLELGGAVKDPYGFERIGFSASTEINRKDFGITTDIPMDGGGVVVGDKIKIDIDAQFIYNNG